MASKRENLLKQIEQAEAKRKAVVENTKHLLEKKAQIEKQITANQKKIGKLDFFLTKTKESLQG